MTRQDFGHYLSALQAQEMVLRRAGQKEYARVGDNAFANFERVGKELGISREKVALVYLLKHLDGVISHVDGHTSQREPVIGRIHDLRLYVALLGAMLEENAHPLIEIDTRSGDPAKVHTSPPGMADFDSAMDQATEAIESALGAEGSADV